MAEQQSDAIDENDPKVQKETKKKSKLLSVFSKSKEKKNKEENSRLPRGQHLSKNFQVLDLGKRPPMDLETWTLTVASDVGSKEVTLQQLKALGIENIKADFHCVTTWSKLDIQWTGISMRKIIDFCKDVIPEDWRFLIQYGKDGYTTNAPRADVEREEVYLVYELDGKPIPPDHGVVRIIIPHLFGWKSSKFLVKLEFSREDKPGFWEVRGYHRRGDVWKEERCGKPEEPLE